MKFTQAIVLTLASAVVTASFAGTPQSATPAKHATPTVVVKSTAPIAKPVNVVNNTKTTIQPTSIRAVPTTKAIPTKPAVEHTLKTGFKCKDGSVSMAKSTRGACSGHGGIKN